VAGSTQWQWGTALLPGEEKSNERVVWHSVTIQQVTKWLEEGGTTPTEVAKKHRLKGLFAPTGRVSKGARE
jgi:hypothetical protein